MSTCIWQPGISGDWMAAACWAGGVPPGAGDTAVLAGTGAYVVTLFGAGAVGSLVLADQTAEFYDAGALSLAGTFTLSAGTFALSYGTLRGGTLALAGGHLLSTGGTLDGTVVQGTLDMTPQMTTLFVRDGLAMAGAGGSGAGSIALVGGYASLEFLGSQTLSNTVVSLGALGTQPGQNGAASLGVTHDASATSGATLTLASNVWVRQAGNAGVGAVLAVGSTGVAPGPTLPDMLVNQGTITANVAGETLEVTGSGTFVNQGAIAVSNGATLALATAGFVNTGVVSVVNATLALGGSFSVGLLSNLGNLALGYGTGQIQILGTASNGGGTLAIGLGSRLSGLLGQISLAGTLQGGTVTDSGGGFGFLAGTGVLDGVTYYAGLGLSLGLAGAAVTLVDGTEILGTAGAPGSIADTGVGGALLLRGTEALDQVAITLGAASAGSTIATSDPFLASAGTTATLGPHTTVVQTGVDATLQASGWSPVPGLGVSDTLINQGTVTAGVLGGLMLVSGYGTFINQGSMVVGGGGTLDVTVSQFANAGTLTAGTGGTLLLGQPAGYYGAAPAWTNAGQIVVAGGTLVLGGALSTAQLGTLTESSGTVVLAGTLSNAGATLALGGHAGAITLQGLSLAGTVLGGTVTDSRGLLSVGTGGGALLDGVSYAGTLALTQTGAALRVRDGLTLSGVADVVGAGSLLGFVGSQTLDHAQILLGAQASASLDLVHDPAVAGSDTLTLGAGMTVTQSGALACIGRAGGVAGDAIVNAGTINAAVAGGTLTLGGPDFINQGHINVGGGETLAIAAAGFSNTGSIAVSSGLVSLSGSMTLAGLGQISLGTGVLSVQGTLNLGGGTLSVGGGTALGRLSLAGTLKGGTIVDAGGGLGANGGATLDGVTYDGTLDLSRPFAQVAVADGLTVNNAVAGHPGTILLTGAEGRLLATTSETFNAVAIALGSVSQYYAGQHIPPPELASLPGVQLGFGTTSTITLNGLAGTLGDSGLGQWSDTIANAGQIIASALGTLTLGGTFLTNTGTIAASGGGVVTIDNTWCTNSGVVSVSTGSAVQVMLLNYYAAPNAGTQVFTNTGTIAMAGGIFQEITANGLFPAVPLANLAGGLIEGSGLVFAQIANAGTIEAHGGSLLLTQPVTGGGALLIDAGATLEEAGVVQAGQVVRFTSPGGASAGGTLKLDAPTSFAGTLGNFLAGDTLDLPGLILTGVGINSGTLVASTATQNFRFASTMPLGGALSSGRDVHGGATITFTPQAPGSGQVLLPVSQSSMLFWASPAGDAFQGSAATIAGAHISNWSAADSIDITDMSPATATLTAVQGAGLDTLTISDGTHVTSVGLTGTYAASAFHMTTDGHGGTLLTFGHG